MDSIEDFYAKVNKTVKNIYFTLEIKIQCLSGIFK